MGAASNMDISLVPDRFSRSWAAELILVCDHAPAAKALQRYLILMSFLVVDSEQLYRNCNINDPILLSIIKHAR